MASCVFNLKYLSQIGHVGDVLKTSGPADFKSAPGFENWPRFVGVIEQNKIFNSLCQSSMLEYSMMDCMFSRYIYPANGS